MNSYFSQLFTAIQNHLITQCALVKWVDIDFGQMENYREGFRPPVLFPCVLVEFTNAQYSGLAGSRQEATVHVQIRIGFTPFSSTNAETPQQYKALALQYFDVEQSIFEALHCWQPYDTNGKPMGSKLLRSTATTENRTDNIRVRVLGFDSTYIDNSVYDAGKQHVARPVPNIVMSTILRSDITFITSFDANGLPIFAAASNIQTSDLAFTKTLITATAGQQVYNTVRPITRFTTIMVFRNGIAINFTTPNSLQIQLVPTIDAGDIINILQQL